MNPPELLVTSPRYWHPSALILRWGRRLCLGAVGVACALVAVFLAIAALTGRSAGPVAHQAADLAWDAPLLGAATMVLARMERTFARYAGACSR